MSYSEPNMINSILIAEGDEGYLQIDETDNPAQVNIPNVSHQYHPSQSTIQHPDISRGQKHEAYGLHEDYHFMLGKQESPIQQQPQEIQLDQQIKHPIYLSPQIRVSPEGQLTPTLQQKQIDNIKNESPDQQLIVQSKDDCKKDQDSRIDTYQIDQQSQIVKLQTIVIEKESQIQLSQRKREAFQNIRIWMEKTKLLTESHLELLEDVFLTLSKRAQNSNKSFHLVLQFLQEYFLLQRNVVKFYQNQTLSSAYSEQDNKIGCLLPQLNEAIQDLVRQQKQKGELIQSQTKILEEHTEKSLEVNLNQYSQKIKGIHNDIYFPEFSDGFHLCQKNINEQISVVKKYYLKYIRHYDEMLKNNGVHKKRTKDLFYSEKIYTCAMTRQIVLQSDMGQLVLQYLLELNQMELSRYECIQKSIKIYEESQHFNTLAIDSLVPQNEAQISLTNIQISIIMRNLDVNIVGIPEIRYFMVDLLNTMVIGSSSLSDHSLVQFQCSQVLEDVGSLVAEWRPVTLVVTLDRNLIITEEQAVRHKLQIEKIELIKKSNNPLIVSLKHSVPRLLFSSSKQILLKFIQPEMYDQFILYIK